jgi:hypothetical protein
MSKFLVYFLSFFVGKEARKGFRLRNAHRGFWGTLFLLKNTVLANLNIVHKVEKFHEYYYLKTNTAPINDLKIIVVYHRPAQLFANKCFVPVNSGRQDMAKVRETQNGKSQNNQYAQKWLLDNTIGDDSGKNISNLNHRVGTFSAFYWARHNMDKIGNPPYVGGCGHSKFLHHYALTECLNYDICVQIKTKFFTSLKKEFIEWHGAFLYNNCIEIFKSINPQMCEKFEKYMQLHGGYYKDNFIMTRDLFFEYVDFVAPIAIKIDKQLEITEPRDIAFFIERLNGFFIYNKTQEGASCKEFTMFDWYK